MQFPADELQPRVQPLQFPADDDEPRVLPVRSPVVRGAPRRDATRTPGSTSAGLYGRQAPGLPDGTLEPGAPADIVLWDVDEIDMLAYHVGLNPLRRCMFRGRWRSS